MTSPWMLSSERLGFAPLSSDLVPTFEQWFNDLETSRTLGVDWRPITRQRKAAHTLKMLSSSDACFAIHELGTSRPIGYCGLNDIDRTNCKAEFSIVIGDPGARGKGYGTEATKLILAYGFDVLGLNHIWLQVTSNNPGAIRAYEKAGFKKIGIRREAVRVGRDLIDDVYMDAIASDFPPSALAALMHPPKETG